jgi:hypothetical protein
MIELAELISDLRGELYRAMDIGRREELQFDLGPIELELRMEIEKAAGAHGKVRFWVVDAGGELSGKNLSGQKIKLTLNPSLDIGGGQRVTPHVSGKAEEGED